MSLPERLAIAQCGPLDAKLAVPGSKSITNRALLAAALAQGSSVLRHCLFADDTRYMIDGLGKLGMTVAADAPQQTCHVTGTDGIIPAARADLFVGNAGTAMRFLTAALTLGHGWFRLDGTERMRQRPIGDLLTALGQLGIAARSEFENGCPPVVMEASGLPGGTVTVDGSQSSQYLSALLLASPYAREPLQIQVTGELQSKPYVDLTLAVMRDFGVPVQRRAYQWFQPEPGRRYQGRDYTVEGDASAAGYFLAAAAIVGGRCRISNVGQRSAQGDIHLADVLERMGCQVHWGANWVEVRRPSEAPLRGGTFDLNALPDQTQTLAAVALFAQGPTRLERVPNLRIKETDRLSALATELSKLGAKVEEGPDYLVIFPGPLRGAEIETYDDHRMAMALALVGLRQRGVVIHHPGCVSKTFPEFFQVLESLANHTG
ncbi:MAG: 3-phosphoshikimate 1-carboxyvinyltransferase [Deinococcus sp.]|nr:3-phosphoshikimate 1-carboxyvinyltransferase [Deinococcus sp.]